jgi:hypothetical protein
MRLSELAFTTFCDTGHGVIASMSSTLEVNLDDLAIVLGMPLFQAQFQMKISFCVLSEACKIDWSYVRQKIEMSDMGQRSYY